MPDDAVARCGLRDCTSVGVEYGPSAGAGAGVVGTRKLCRVQSSRGHMFKALCEPNPPLFVVQHQSAAMRTTMAKSATLMLLVCCALLHPAESIDIKMSALVFDPFKAVLRFEGYGKVGCAQTGSSLDACLKGGLEVYDTPAGDVTGESLYLLSKLETAPENPNYLCPPVVGDFDRTNITLTGYIDIEPDEAITLTVKSTAGKPNQFVLAFDTCEYVYKVEESFDRNTDGLPDFLGKKGEVADVLGAWATKIISQALSAVVAVTVFTNLGSQFLDKFMAMAGVEDLLAVAENLSEESVGVAGGKKYTFFCLRRFCICCELECQMCISPLPTPVLQSLRLVSIRNK